MSGAATRASRRTTDPYRTRRIQAVAARWDAKAETWDNSLADPVCHLNEDDAYRRFLDFAYSVIAARRTFCARHGLIDLGCGTGLVLAKFASEFAWSIGVDISKKMIEAAERKRLPNAKLLIGDGFELPAICPRAGAILSRGVLLSHYGREQGRALLRAAAEALVPGGFLIFDFLNVATAAQYKHRPQAKTFFTPEEVSLMARGAGLRGARILGDNFRRVLLLLAKS